MNEQLLSAIVGGAAGTIASLLVVLYAARVEREPDVSVIALTLAAITVRLRREVLRQFVKLHAGPWLPEAIERQQGILAELGDLLPLVRRNAPDAYVYVLATYEALISNTTRLQRWLHAGHTTDRNESLLGSTFASHHELFAAAYLANQSLDHLPSDQARRAKNLAPQVNRLRQRGIVAFGGITDSLHRLTDEQREEWARTGFLPTLDAEPPVPASGADPRPPVAPES